MSTTAQSIREIVNSQPSAAKIFRRFDIDLCSQADVSLERACRDLQLSVDQVLEKLADAEAQRLGGVALDPANLPLGRLMQHIVRVHHHCVRQELPRLAELASMVAAKRSDRAPELIQIAELIETLRRDLYAHIEKEELILFPFISQLDQESTGGCPPPHVCFRTVAQPIFMMEQEHQGADRIVTELIRLTHHFTPPSWACVSHAALFSGLKEFDSDLRQHVHLEDNFLFPRAIQLETEIKARR